MTSLPRQAGDAALTFDPDNTADIVDALRQVWQEQETRKRLVNAGHERIAKLSWKKTCRVLRAHYRRVLGVTLADSDKALLSAPPVL